MAWPRFSIAGLLLWALWVPADSNAQTPGTPQEVEVTVDWIRAIDPELASGAKLESYDRLAFGKVRFLRLEGKSRKSALFSLGSDNKQLVRLFDLPPFDLKVFSSGREYYFGGVLSKVERNQAGVIEAIITYSNVSEVEGRFYSRQAKEFVERTEQIKQRNEAILGKSAPPAATRPETETQPVTPPAVAPPAAQPAATPPAATPPATAPPAEPKPSSRAEAPNSKEEDEDTDDLPRNRPVLKRRMGEEPEQSATTTPRETASEGRATQPASDDDVVIYRRKDGSRRPASTTSPSSVPSTRSDPESSDRPVLRRQPATLDEKKEVDGMMLVPEGSVTLGSDQPDDTEKPLHRVELKAFYMDKHEVTNEDYKQFCDATAHTVPPYWTAKAFPKGLEKHPVVQVSWADATAYARWAGKRLPTEAEWERAAKGPNSYRYAYGNSFDAQKANTGSQKTSAVASYPANEFGLFDMAGNVSEWTSSLYRPYPYSSSDGREDPKAAGARAVRGGNHSSSAQGARCLVRQKELPDHGSPLLGFRCARDAN
jgi:formylglycine-generating enzyme required for sulfatase activity